MSGIESIIAGAAFEIVARSFTSRENSERNSFRLKNLTRGEALEFLRVWQHRSAERGLGPVRLLVASDSHDEFPQAFRADPEHSITYYRNNNEHGLVYIETKVESDEQGLKNIFTLRDVNFLDGTFDEDGEFLVPEEMVKQALSFTKSPNPDGNELLRDRLVEVLRGLNGAGMTVPVRKFAGFVLAAAENVVSGTGVYSPEDTRRYRYYVSMDVIKKRPKAELRGPQRLPGGMVEDAVVGEIRRLLRTPEVAARVSRTLRKDRPDLGEADISASLTQFDDMWKALIPAEQARVVRLLVARVTASDAGLAVDLRHEGLGAIAALMAPAKSEVA